MDRSRWRRGAITAGYLAVLLVIGGCGGVASTGTTQPESCEPFFPAELPSGASPGEPVRERGDLLIEPGELDEGFHGTPVEPRYEFLLWPDGETAWVEVMWGSNLEAYYQDEFSLRRFNRLFDAIGSSADVVDVNGQRRLATRADKHHGASFQIVFEQDGCRYSVWLGYGHDEPVPGLAEAQSYAKRMTATSRARG